MIRSCCTLNHKGGVMKIKNLVLVCTLMIVGLSTFASKECQIKTLAINDENPDYKTDHYVKCYCPCKQYKMLPRGTCSYCGHYRYPSDWKIIRSVDKSRNGKHRHQKRDSHHKKAPMTCNEKLNEVFGEHAATPSMDN